MESENLELNQQVGELGRALGQEAAAYQAQVMMVVKAQVLVKVLVMEMVAVVVILLTVNAKVAAKEQELRRLQEELRQQGDQYTRLLDTKVTVMVIVMVMVMVMAATICQVPQSLLESQLGNLTSLHLTLALPSLDKG